LEERVLSTVRIVLVTALVIARVLLTAVTWAHQNTVLPVQTTARPPLPLVTELTVQLHLLTLQAVPEMTVQGQRTHPALKEVTVLVDTVQPALHIALALLAQDKLAQLTVPVAPCLLQKAVQLTAVEPTLLQHHGTAQPPRPTPLPPLVTAPLLVLSTAQLALNIALVWAS